MPMARSLCDKIVWVSKVAAGASCAGAFGLCLYGYWQNHHLKVTEYRIMLDHLSPDDDGFTIAQISDLHSTDAFIQGCTLNPQNDRLIEALAFIRPNLIAITGDLYDSRNPQLERIVAQAHRFAEVAPTYMVSGNHECRPCDNPNAREATISEDQCQTYTTNLDLMRVELAQAGVRLIDDDFEIVKAPHHPIIVMGLRDPLGLSSKTYVQTQERLVKKVDSVQTGYDQPLVKMLLSHRPEQLKSYAAMGVDLVLSGHAHGGQWRIPGVGGVFSPNQGLFPQYTSGLHYAPRPDGKRVTMVVSRGLANSSFPLRINNRVELVVVRLVSAQKVQA